MKAGNADGAIKQFKELLRLRPRSAEAHYSLGNAYARAKRFGEASTLLQKALKLDPGYRQARMMLDEIEVYQGEGQRAKGKGQRAESEGLETEN